MIDTPTSLAGGDNLQPAPKDTIDAIEAIWKTRRDAIHPGRQHTLTCQKAEVEFFAGAMSALQAMGYQYPAYWVIAIMSGRRIPEIKKVTK